MKIIIVNENDEIIDHKERGTILKEDIYRVSSLWLENSRGEVLLARRALTKSHSPGLWGPAVAGTNDEGETYEQNMVKEAEEEIGLTGITFVKGEKMRRETGFNYFLQLFSATVDWPLEKFRVQEEEVADIKWWTKEELIKATKEHPEEFLSFIIEQTSSLRQ